MAVRIFSPNVGGFPGGPNGPLSVASTCPLPGATIGQPYAIALAAAGGTSPYTFAISVGSLPAGLSLAGAVISGTPTGPSGTVNFTIQVTDSAARTATKACSIVVADALFADSFQRADQPALVGTQWQTSWDPTNSQAGSALLGTQLAGCVNVTGGTQLQISNPLGGSVTPVLYCLPIPLGLSLSGLTQYSQLKVVSTVNFVRFGPCVAADANGGTCYYLCLDSGGQYFLRKMPAGTVLIAQNAGRTFANGDTLKLKYSISAGTVTLTIAKNGVDIISTTDVGGLATGVPGMYGEGMGVGGVVAVSFYQGGSGVGP